MPRCHVLNLSNRCQPCNKTSLLTRTFPTDTTGRSGCTAPGFEFPFSSPLLLLLLLLIMSVQVDARALQAEWMGRGVVSIQRVLWLEYEVEGSGADGVRQRLEQHMLQDAAFPCEWRSSL